MVRRISQLIVINDKGSDATGHLPPWQKHKLLSQAGQFTLNKLLLIYKKMLDIESSIKNGDTLMSLSWHLDLLISDL